MDTNTNNTAAQYLIKGDVSGIQEFIFNVSSKKAAKTLKARSAEIEDITDNLINGLQLTESEKIYNGGGNFYVIANKTVLDKIHERQIAVNKKYATKGVYLSISKTAGYKQTHFNESWVEVNRLANINKIQKYRNNSEIFTPQKIDIPVIDNVSKDLPKWNTALKNECKSIIDNQVKEKIEEREPYPDEIISFVYLAKFAELRTGTDNIAVLKMDVDNLSKLFENIDNEADAKKLSAKFSEFFGKKFLKIIKDDKSIRIESNTLKNKLVNNIYPVFAGGDDCFIIGAFDYVTELTQTIRNEFNQFVTDLKKELIFVEPILKNEKFDITISAALDFFAPHYPIKKIAAKMKYDLDNLAKERKQNGKIVKNAICLMGEVLSWNDFDLFLKMSQKLRDFITQKKADKSLLYRIAQSGVEFNILQNNALEGNIDLPKIWKLYNSLRIIRNQRDREDIQKQMISIYEKALFDAFARKMQNNPAVFPLAARYTELLTRKK